MKGTVCAHYHNSLQNLQNHIIWKELPVQPCTKPVSVSRGGSWSCPIEFWISPKKEIWLLPKVEEGGGEILISTQNFPSCNAACCFSCYHYLLLKNLYFAFSTVFRCIAVDSSKTSPDLTFVQRQFPWSSLLYNELQAPDHPYWHDAIMFYICSSGLGTSCGIWECYLTREPIQQHYFKTQRWDRSITSSLPSSFGRTWI